MLTTPESGDLVSCDIVASIFFALIVSSTGSSSDCCGPETVLKRGSQGCHCVYPIKLDILLLNVSANPNWNLFLQQFASQLVLRVSQIELINFHLLSLSRLNISMDVTPHTGVSFTSSEASVINSSLSTHKVHLDPKLVGGYELLNLTWFKPVAPAQAPGIAKAPTIAPPHTPSSLTPANTSSRGKHMSLILLVGIGFWYPFSCCCLCTNNLFTWGAFWAAFWSYVLCWNLGVSVSYHRNLAHRSLKLPKWLEYTFAYFGVLSFTGDPIFWVSMHRYHHQYVDSDKDPHSPVFGFWFSHMGWLFDRGYIIEKFQKHKNVEDLQRQTFYRFLQRTYTWHICGFVALVYAYGGFSSLVWVVGVTVRTIWGYHVTFLVNSLSHIWGVQTWKTGDLSKNNWWLALISFGEGWHNNHHAFEYSARHGLEWWQIDMGWYMIRFLEALGLASNVKFPTKAQKLKKSSASLNS